VTRLSNLTAPAGKTADWGYLSSFISLMTTLNNVSKNGQSITYFFQGDAVFMAGTVITIEHS
jgi:hypothetical protein